MPLQLDPRARHDEGYYDALRQELRGDSEVPEIQVDDHPVTATDEITIGGDLAFTNDASFASFEIGKATAITDGDLYVQLYGQCQVQAFLGLETSASNKRTTPTWKLIDDYAAVPLESILVIGDLFTKGMKLKVNTSNAIQLFLAQRKRLLDIRGNS